MKLVNKRMRTMDMSGSLYDIYEKSIKMQNEGRSIIHMEIGKPDFDSPLIAKEAAKRSLDEGFVHYTEISGILELREAILKKESEKNGIYFDVNSEIIVTAGACEAIMAFFLAVLDSGDEIIIPSPYFSAYKEAAHIAGIVVNEVHLKLENNFELKVEHLEKALTDRTKALLINSPHNPTGSIIERETMERIAEFAIKHDLIVVSDETYDQFIFEGEHISISTMPGMKERTVIINSASKIFSMTGWRVGYAIAPKEVIRYMHKVHTNMSTCAASFIQVGVAEAYSREERFTKNMIEEFRIRRDTLVSGLKQIKGINLVVPKGSFYLMFDIAPYGMTDREFCNRLLEKTGLAITPGDSFGKYGKGLVRLSYACKREEIEEAVRRIKNFVEELQSVTTY